MEKNKKNFLREYVIGSAIIWAATILGCALILKETFSQISLLVSSAATIHLTVICGSLAAKYKKQGEEDKAEIGIKG